MTSLTRTTLVRVMTSSSSSMSSCSSSSSMLVYYIVMMMGLLLISQPQNTILVAAARAATGAGPAAGAATQNMTSTIAVIPPITVLSPIKGSNWMVHKYKILKWESGHIARVNLALCVMEQGENDQVQALDHARCICINIISSVEGPTGRYSGWRPVDTLEDKVFDDATNDLILDSLHAYDFFITVSDSSDNTVTADSGAFSFYAPSSTTTEDSMEALTAPSDSGSSDSLWSFLRSYLPLLIFGGIFVFCCSLSIYAFCTARSCKTRYNAERGGGGSSDNDDVFDDWADDDDDDDSLAIEAGAGASIAQIEEVRRRRRRVRRRRRRLRMAALGGHVGDSDDDHSGDSETEEERQATATAQRRRMPKAIVHGKPIYLTTVQSHTVMLSPNASRLVSHSGDEGNDFSEGCSSHSPDTLAMIAAAGAGGAVAGEGREAKRQTSRGGEHGGSKRGRDIQELGDDDDDDDDNEDGRKRGDDDDDEGVVDKESVADGPWGRLLGSRVKALKKERAVAEVLTPTSSAKTPSSKGVFFIDVEAQPLSPSVDAGVVARTWRGTLNGIFFGPNGLQAHLPGSPYRDQNRHRNDDEEDDDNSDSAAASLAQAGGDSHQSNTTIHTDGTPRNRNNGNGGSEGGAGGGPDVSHVVRRLHGGTQSGIGRAASGRPVEGNVPRRLVESNAMRSNSLLRIVAGRRQSASASSSSAAAAAGAGDLRTLTEMTTSVSSSPSMEELQQTLCHGSQDGERGIEVGTSSGTTTPNSISRPSSLASSAHIMSLESSNLNTDTSNDSGNGLNAVISTHRRRSNENSVNGRG